jgi:hypothetical protein
MYQPQPFYEAESVGPAVTFGDMPYNPSAFYEAESVGPAVTFGEAPTHAEAQVLADAEFLAKYGHAIPQNYEEANWLDERVNAIKGETGLTKVVEVKTPQGKTVEMVGTQSHVDPGWWGGMSTGGKAAVAGGAGLGVLGLVMLARRGRRTNPRRRGMLPIVAVGGLAALLWWGGKKTVEAAEATIPQR